VNTTVEKYKDPMVPQVQQGPRTMMDTIHEATMRGTDIAVIKELMALHKDFEAGQAIIRAEQARKDFYEAKAAFKKSAPDVFKDMENTQFKSQYASIGNLVTTINSALAAHGLDAAWNVEQGDKVKVTCVLTHLSGHQECVSLSAPPDTSGGGSKNPIQQIKSTITYLRVATYELVTGTASKHANKDDDGNGSQATPEKITEAQLAELIELADSVGADKTKFCRYYKIDGMAEILQSQFEAAKKALNSKRKVAA
jgi:hypothetical protein